MAAWFFKLANEGEAMADGSMTVREGLAQSMALSNFWFCKAVAHAHPAQALEEIDGRIPGLWLAKQGPWPTAARDLMEALDPELRRRAVAECSRHATTRSLRAIHACMAYRAEMPAQSKARRLRREAKLAKELARVIHWAGRGQDALPAAQAKHAACAGMAEAMARFGSDFPNCRLWLADLRWESLAEAALARAERKWIDKALKVADGSRAPARASTRL